jgi:hypothetical protein
MGKCIVRRNPSWTHKASILSEFGTEQLELIQTSLKTGNPEYARKTEAVIVFLNRLFPDRVRPHPQLGTLVAAAEGFCAACMHASPL